MWELFKTGANPVIVHVIPLFDDLDHALSKTCPCAPQVDDECATVVRHNAFDGRELFERRERLPS
jgi:hypothetical protein